MVLEKAIERIQGKEEGFTLVELLIVVAIIAILAAIAIPQFSAYRKRGYVAAINADTKNVYTAAQAYLVDNPGAQPTCAQLQSTGYNPSTIGGFALTCTSTIAQSSGAITISGSPNWGLTTDFGVVNYAGVITPAAP